MAVVMGTNAGFVTEAPVDDPGGSAFTVDYWANALKDTSPATAGKVTEIGWWCGDATEEADFDVAIYDHNVGDNNPEARIGVSANNAKGTDAGWKRITGLNIPITAETIYWIALQVDNTATSTKTDQSFPAGPQFDNLFQATALPNPWGVSNNKIEDRIFAIYAVYEAAPVGTNMKINIADAWKDIDSLKINIGDAWKNVIKIQQNIGDVWKTVFG